MTTSPADRESETDLGDLVMRVARGLRQRGAAVTAPWDLAPHQARALRVVARHGQVRPGRIAAHLRVAPRSVTDVIDALEERGLVERAPDADDRRATVVTLTASHRCRSPRATRMTRSPRSVSDSRSGGEVVTREC